jgi:hypothetical protein
MKIDYKRHLRIIAVVSIVVPMTITYGQLEESTIGVKKVTQNGSKTIKTPIKMRRTNSVDNIKRSLE